MPEPPGLRKRQVPMPDATFTDNTERRRFELHVGGELAALIAYGSKGGMLALTHTETEPGFEGQGYARQLVEHVLDHAEAQGVALLPFCPYVSAYLVKHPERANLVPERYHEAFGLTEATS